MVERIRKRRAFADPELNQVSDATLLNVAAVSHLNQPAYYEYEPIQHYPLTYASTTLTHHSPELPQTTAPVVASTLSSEKCTNSLEIETPVSKKPKLSFSIEAIMGFK